MSLRTLKTKKKKTEIIQSATSIIEEKGFHNTTMEEIAANLLMTKGSLYYYFKNKQDLLFQSQVLLLEQSIGNIASIIENNTNPKNALKKAITTHIEYLIEEQATFAMGVNPEQFFEGDQLDTILELRHNYAQHVDQLLLNMMEEKAIETKDVKLVRNLLLGAMNWMIEWYSPQGSLGSDELAEKMTMYLMKIVETESK
ncbi:MAG TPA: TetR/AcrR family transcriptional regulator [Pseudogracilibacillus sp.]|nr:TetR/AcrR family transcriptional regulator [Pseudogracilibacillus sp.]